MNEPRLDLLFGHQQQPASEARLKATWKWTVIEVDRSLATVKCDRGHIYKASLERCPDCWAQRDRHLQEW